MPMKTQDLTRHHPPGVTVFCGARPGSDPAYIEEARVLGQGLARRGLRLVYGGGNTGLMGALANALHANGGTSLGVVPAGLFTTGVASGASSLVTAPNLRERKALMRANADVILALPGGLGTLDEVVESAVERQLGIHQKPVVLIDTNGYWDRFFDALIHMVDKGFLEAALPPVLILASSAEDGLQRIDGLLGTAAGMPETD